MLRKCCNVLKKMKATEQIVAVYEGFVEQHLLLAAAGVPAGVGYQGFFGGQETTMQIGTSEYFQRRLSAIVHALGGGGRDGSTGHGRCGNGGDDGGGGNSLKVKGQYAK